MTNGLVRVAASRAHAGLLFLLVALLFACGARAAGAGYWHTSGNQILDANNQPVRIAAINWYGFETTTFVAHGLWIADYKAILDRIKTSGFNTVRIPYSDQMVSQNPVLGTLNINRDGINTDIAANATALDVLDKIIAYCGQIGLRVMLDNHRSNAGNSAQENGLWFTSEFPESTWLANWRALTTRYLGNTTVVAMDLRNEPHASACWGGDPAGCSAANDWHAAATRAGNAILAINPNLLIVVEGNDHYNNSFTWWGGMLRGVATRPVTLNVANRVVYSAHDYGPVEANQPWFNGSATPATLNAIKDQNWGYIYNQGIGPMFVGEFGTLNGNADIQSTTPGSQGQWFSATVSYFQGKQWMGHAYWAMNGNDRYALFNNDFNGIVNQSKLTLLQTIQFPLDQQPGNVPAITSVTPTTVLPGTAVTINGSNFGTTQGTSTVRFGAITVSTITSWSASQISVTAPTNLPPGAYAVVVTVNGVASNAATINVPVVDQFPQVSSLSPNSGGVGQLVNVNGAGFGTTQGTSTVRFGTTLATVQLWANSNVLVAVPNLAPGTYPVTVTVGGRVSNAMNFLVTVHRLNSITPNTGNPGASVTLAGTGFGATQGANTVRFGTTTATVTSWSNTQIVATVPNLTGGTAVGVAVVVGGVASNEVNFLVTSPMPPVLATLTPNSGPAGSTVAITGSNFGVFQNTSTVRFGTTNATVVSWSNTQLAVNVPNIGAGTVPVTVTVNGNVSNAANFTVTTVQQPGFAALCPNSLTINRGASGGGTCTITRSGGFTGAVSFTTGTLPTGVSVTFSPNPATGNSTTMNISVASTAAIGSFTFSITTSAAGVAGAVQTVLLQITQGPVGGVVTATGAVASNSPWFAEEQVRFSNTAPLTALTVTITVARNPAALASGGQYNTIGGNLISQSVSTTSTQVVYTFALIAGQTLAAGTGRTFAAQFSPGGNPHPTTGDSWSVTYTSGGASTTTSGTF
ncbi:MAG TPA: IPT/TIG domain-containing protein [Steroidobacteraceae bacterium]|nr:IPT/TIG domain-containing protein [Steroidobacteraceae bacterium]